MGHPLASGSGCKLSSLFQRELDMDWSLVHRQCRSQLRSWANFSARHPHSGDQTEGRDRTTRADKAKHYTIAGGSATESASHLDVMRVDELTDAELYARGVELLERIVAMLTKLINPCSSRASFTLTQVAHSRSAAGSLGR